MPCDKRTLAARAGAGQSDDLRAQPSPCPPKMMALGPHELPDRFRRPVRGADPHPRRMENPDLAESPRRRLRPEKFDIHHQHVVAATGTGTHQIGPPRRQAPIAWIGVSTHLQRFAIDPRSQLLHARRVKHWEDQDRVFVESRFGAHGVHERQMETGLQPPGVPAILCHGWSGVISWRFRGGNRHDRGFSFYNAGLQIDPRLLRLAESIVDKRTGEVGQHAHGLRE